MKINQKRNETKPERKRVEKEWGKRKTERERRKAAVLARKKEVKPVSGVLHKAVSIIDAAAEEAVDEVDEEAVDDDDNEEQDEAVNHAALLKLLLLCSQVEDAHLIFSCPIAKAFYVIKRNRCESLIAKARFFCLPLFLHMLFQHYVCPLHCLLLCCITSANRVCTFFKYLLFFCEKIHNFVDKPVEAPLRRLYSNFVTENLSAHILKYLYSFIYRRANNMFVCLCKCVKQCCKTILTAIFTGLRK